LKRLGPESVAELLTKSEREALDNVLTVAKAVRSGETLASASQSTTAQNLAVHALLRGPGEIPGAIAGGLLGATGYGSVGALGGMAAGGAIGSRLSMILTPAVVARMLTDERAVKELASPGFRQIATDLRLRGPLRQDALLTLERLGAILLTDAASRRESPAPSR
jgi:hypothetical protein